MGTNGNGTTQTTQQLDQLNAVAAAATQATSVDDFLARAESALGLLEAVAREVGSAGGADEREIIAFCQGQRSDLHAFVRKLIRRYEGRAGDMRRILGKVEG